MWKIPVGRLFESLVDWIRHNLSIVLETIDTVLDAVIGTLEQLLLLNPVAIYPALAASLLAGLIGYSASGRFSKKTRLFIAILALTGMGGAEIWRYHTLQSEISVAEAKELTEALKTYREDLLQVAPPDYGRIVILLDAMRRIAPDDSDYIRHLGRIERRLGRLKAYDFSTAASLVMDVRELFEGDRIEVEVTDTVETLITENEHYYLSLAGIQESERLIHILENLETPELRSGLLNQRHYEEALAYLDASIINASYLGIDRKKSTGWENLRRQLTSLNPGKLSLYPALVIIALFSGIAYLTAGGALALFSVFGFLLILSMGYWVATMETLALVLGATFFALLIGVPTGIWAARSNFAHQTIRPVLDFMQTMPAFVYLIPAVLFFGLGRVPGAVATLIFAMPPAVRLTALGIRQVPREVIEAGLAFGATPRQLLFKTQLPIALPTILAGLNQTIMLALSMVVIGGMIGAGGLGAQVLIGITQMKIDIGFESGLAVVILAIVLDRITQQIGGSHSD